MTIVIGAGIFGVTAALELSRRGRRVIVLEPELPHRLAASTDVSKAVRLEYGADEYYVALGERALDGWRRWNHELGETVFHETGVLFMRRGPAGAGTFEDDSYHLLRRRGHPVERIDGAGLARWPAWRPGSHSDGIYNPVGGWVEAARTVERLAAVAAAEGVDIRRGVRVAALADDGERVSGVITSDGERIDATTVVVAAGSWTPHLLPFTAPWFRSTAMPVFHLRPADPSLFEAARFPVFGADISSTGYYGFPLHPRAGIVKIANHGIGRDLHPESPARAVTDGDLAALRAFLADTFPSLADAPIAATRVCLYCDTWDGHFWIAPDPTRAGLVLATGGSGHAFKFAPLLGGLIADAVDGVVVPRFRHRPDARPPRSDEAARASR